MYPPGYYPPLRPSKIIRSELLHSGLLVVTKNFTKKFFMSLSGPIQSDPDLPGRDIPEPRLTGRINFPRYRNLTVFHPDIPGTPIYRAKSFPPRIPVNRGPTVLEILLEEGKFGSTTS
eukprot:sb/3476405/